MPHSLINAEMRQTLRELAAASPPGSLVEVGVYKGGSAAELYAVAQEQGRALFLFDTFEGMPLAGPLDTHKVGDFADTSAEAVAALFPNATVCVGVFPQTLGQTGAVAFVHADADQYESTHDICLALGPRMVPGGAMLFDDYCLPGCAAAVHEFYPDCEVLPDGRALVRF